MFTQAITPAIRSYLEVQVSFMTDMGNRMFDAAQSTIELNLRLAKELLEDMTRANRQLMQTTGAQEFASTAGGQLQPSAQRWRNYQQQLSNVVANANVEMTKVAQTHLPEVRRSAAAMADDVVRAAAQEAEKAVQRQREVLASMNESARRGIEGMAQSQSRLSNDGRTPGQQAH